MDFFDFYGNKFDYGSVGIRMDPPGYFNKVTCTFVIPSKEPWTNYTDTESLWGLPGKQESAPCYRGSEQQRQ